MPRVAKRTEQQVMEELSTLPPHPTSRGREGFYLDEGVIIWTNGAVAVRWPETEVTLPAFQAAGINPRTRATTKGYTTPMIDFDKLVPDPKEPTSSVGLDVFLANKVFRFLGSSTGFIQHIGNVYYAKLELVWNDCIYEVEVVIAGIPA